MDAGLLDEATAFMDDVQNALDEVSGLVDLIANAPSFGDPTTQLPQMLDLFKGMASSGGGTLTKFAICCDVEREGIPRDAPFYAPSPSGERRG